MGRKFIVEEVEEKSNSGCGTVIAIIIVVIIGILGGFKSCNNDEPSDTIETQTEASQHADEAKIQTRSYTPKNSPAEPSSSTPTAASQTLKEDVPGPAIEIKSAPDNNAEAEETVADPIISEQEEDVITETNSEEPTLTEKERRKAERQAKREARRKEKAQKNN